MTKQQLTTTLDELILKTSELGILFVKRFFTKEDIEKYGYSEKIKKYKKRSFFDEYHIWYSESLKIVKIFMYERYDEFINQYQPEKKEKNWVC